MTESQLDHPSASAETASPPPAKTIAPGRLLVYVAVAAACIFVGVLTAGPLRSAGGWALDTLTPDDSPNQPIDTANTPRHTSGDGGGGVTLYQSGMHPWIITTEPGNCPICGMKLEPIDPAKLTGEVTIDPVVVQNMGVRTAEVVRGPVTRTLRTVGTVEVAEPLVRDVNLRVSGWIESLDVDFVGAEVEAGDRLFTVYSPQLYAAQEEYLLALRSGGDQALVTSAQDRLLNFGLTESQVERLAEGGRAPRTTPILSPHRGVVLDKHANEGMNVDPGMRVFRIADLSRVWVQATLYESQLPFVELGQPGTITVSGLPGRAYEGQVVFVDPMVNPQTRAVQVRLSLDNPDRQFKPGMFADVTLRNTLAEEATLVPREAVIDTGPRAVTFVSLGQGRFEPREVVTGVEAEGGMLQVINGLNAGEHVVVSGQFLLDSEASVRASLARMVRGDQAAAQSPVVPATLSSNTEGGAGLSDQAQQQIDHAARAYLVIQDALTRDTLDGLDEPLAQLAEAAMHLGHLGSPDLQRLATAVQTAAKIETRELDGFREAFGPMSETMIALLSQAPQSTAVGEAVYVTHCPMVNRDWLQAAPAIRNPYATYMLECGSVERAITALPAASPKPDVGEQYDQ